ncbi:MAG: pyruvate dehydrogenase (acetyl-transferring) E1 component subunit alpha [Nitrososphaerota archaeon]|nr:pyruvate dehydrogenase (acetyl-transferring) E1 component subunit alpha [Nitrososphaerota archaeon]
MSHSDSPEMLRVILSDGSRNDSLEPKLPETDLKRIYRSMLETRLFDSKCLNMQRQGRIGFYVPCAGQEAAQIGSAFALNKDDWVLPTYRDTGVVILKGIALTKLFAHLMGNKEDLMMGRQMPNHWGFKEFNFVSIASTIAAHLPVAVGVAMAIKMRRENKIVMSWHGEGATSEGDFHAAYNFAGVYKAPIVFICENNGWAISLPSSRQTASRTFADKAIAYGFEGIRVDGNDALAVYAATKKAVEKARLGKGPTMIECLTYRMGPHSTSDDPNRYRTKEEIEDWRKRDPIERFRSYLEKKGYWTKDYEESLRSQIENELNTAIKEQEAIGKSELISMFEDVYSEMPDRIKEQYAEELKFSEKQSE